MNKELITRVKGLNLIASELTEAQERIKMFTGHPGGILRIEYRTENTNYHLDQLNPKDLGYLDIVNVVTERYRLRIHDMVSTLKDGLK